MISKNSLNERISSEHANGGICEESCYSQQNPLWAVTFPTCIVNKERRESHEANC